MLLLALNRFPRLRAAPLRLTWRVVVMLASVFCAMPLSAQSASFSGVVLAAGDEKPLVNAEVVIDDLGTSARTDSSGKYSFAAVSSGQHHVTVRYVGYEPYAATLTFTGKAKVEADFVLTRMTVLAPVDINAPYAKRLQEFDNRRKMGFGKFLTYEQIASQNQLTMSTMIAKNFSGLRAGTKAGSGVISARGENCPVQILINDFVVYNGDPIFFDVNTLQTMNILGIEFYTMLYTPMEYMKRPRGNTGGSPCGTMFIWTK